MSILFLQVVRNLFCDNEFKNSKIFIFFEFLYIFFLNFNF
jgi:hypothetical protein